MDCNKSKQHQFVSIIVPTFNRKTELEQCVKSLLNLTYKDYEIIIVDDGSSDGTEELIRGLDANIVYIRQKNAGPAVARNTGIQHMKGEFAVFTDSDCIVDKKWLEDCFEKRNNSMWSDYASELYEKVLIQAQAEGWDDNFTYLLYENQIESNDVCRFKDLQGIMLQSPKDEDGYSKHADFKNIEIDNESMEYSNAG